MLTLDHPPESTNARSCCLSTSASSTAHSLSARHAWIASFSMAMRSSTESFDLVGDGAMGRGRAPMAMERSGRRPNVVCRGMCSAAAELHVNATSARTAKRENEGECIGASALDTCISSLARFIRPR